jgi:uncharacterized alpha/beta hydrolase family protein
MFEQTQEIILEINKLKRTHNFTQFHYIGHSQGALLGIKKKL